MIPKSSESCRTMERWGRMDIVAEIRGLVFQTVEVSPDAVFWAEATDRLCRANAAACRRFGFEAEDTSRLPADDFRFRYKLRSLTLAVAENEF